MGISSRTVPFLLHCVLYDSQQLLHSLVLQSNKKHSLKYFLSAFVQVRTEIKINCHSSFNLHIYICLLYLLTTG